MRITLSISIVVYNENFSDIKDCLTSLILSIPKEFEYVITIVDNGACELNKVSTIKEACLRYFSDLPIQYILSSKNGGYGYGHNLAIFSSVADYHLIINSDVYTMTETLRNAVAFMQANPNVSMLVPDVYDVTNKRVYLCKENPRLWISFLRRFAPNLLRNIFKNQLERFEMRNKDYDSPIFNLTNPTGCFMFCRLAILKAIKGFDEKIFMYYEDSDLGRRLAKVSQIAYVPSVKIKHAWKRAAYHNKRMAWIAIKSAVYYAWKWRW
ncbi:MAG: glycosyltransferase [Rickettsiella sp.]|nr:glycosyltransferase [Rickettsiella sp.]